MPQRFQVLERIAFSLVVMSAVFCSAFIAWESNPDLQATCKTVLQLTGEYSSVCIAASNDPCAQLPVE
ncbi:hypothetical protein [Paraburkholderia sp.]|uniref:hypothetical protein n=1 Tax=Paraburkholderia sp. TaxID=1926495 RepID=UPI00238C92EE|nr:hypothetical protein [Paraburkholderia sp.]MDE1184131.1 hypothetical protein [Paraburkholderia sp.]